MTILEENSGDGLVSPLQGGADARDIEPIAGLDVPVLHIGGLEGEHAPVDHVGAVALGGKLGAQVGTAPQHPLAGGGLFPGGTVAGFERHDKGAQTSGLRVVAQKGVGVFPGAALPLLGLDGFCPGDVLGVLPGEGKFAQA